MRSSFETDVTPCVNVPQRPKKRFPGRWSLRQLFYSTPILNRRRNQNNSGPSAKNHAKDVTDATKSVSSAKDVDRGIAACQVEIHPATSRTSIFTASAKSSEGTSATFECPLCLVHLHPKQFFQISSCGHRACRQCLDQYMRVEISESRVCIACPVCSEPVHPNEIKFILKDQALYEKYEDFMVRRVLAAEPDTRWCPAPDCGFAVIASECASCPKIKCERPGCNSYFCYHCKAEWHPNQTCDAARAQRSPNLRSSSISYSQDSQHRDDIKPCPRCQVLIVKMDDGSCNHMMCAVCGAEFCWLCMKEISDLHYLSPSGCTFWGKKPWSRKKKILWQLGTLVGAPVGIALVAGITVPAMIIGIPVWIGRKMYTRYKNSNKHKRNAAIIGGVIASVIISPILAGLAVGIGVPILLFYVYGVVPVSLCRSGGCTGGASSEDAEAAGGGGNASSTGGAANCVAPPYDAVSMMMDDAASIATATLKATDPSIGEATSISMGSRVGLSTGVDADRESASTTALAGSAAYYCPGTTTAVLGQRLEVQADMNSVQRFSTSSLSESMEEGGSSSIRTGPGSIVEYKINTDNNKSKVDFFDDIVNIIDTELETLGSYRGSYCAPSIPQTDNDQVRAEGQGGEGGASNDNNSVCIEITLEKKPRKYVSQSALLRSQFFRSTMKPSEPPSPPSLPTPPPTPSESVVQMEGKESFRRISTSSSSSKSALSNRESSRL